MGQQQSKKRATRDGPVKRRKFRQTNLSHGRIQRDLKRWRKKYITKPE
jgi:hypothetical protein